MDKRPPQTEVLGARPEPLESSGPDRLRFGLGTAATGALIGLAFQLVGQLDGFEWRLIYGLALLLAAGIFSRWIRQTNRTIPRRSERSSVVGIVGSSMLGMAYNFVGNSTGSEAFDAQTFLRVVFIATPCILMGVAISLGRR